MPSQALSATCAALSSRGDGAKNTPLQGAVGQENTSPVRSGPRARLSQEQTHLVQWIKQEHTTKDGWASSALVLEIDLRG